MARTKGTFSLSANLEPLAAAPLDARERVNLKTDLTAEGTFPYPYEGMEVYVVEEKKRYTLIGSDPTVASNWKVAEGGEDTLAVTDTVPTPTADTLGQTILYVGSTTDSYQQGGIYECTSVLIADNQTIQSRLVLDEYLTEEYFTITGSHSNYDKKWTVKDGITMLAKINNGSLMELEYIKEDGVTYYVMVKFKGKSEQNMNTPSDNLTLQNLKWSLINEATTESEIQGIILEPTKPSSGNKAYYVRIPRAKVSGILTYYSEYSTSATGTITMQRYNGFISLETNEPYVVGSTQLSAYYDSNYIYIYYSVMAIRYNQKIYLFADNIKNSGAELVETKPTTTTMKNYNLSQFVSSGTLGKLASITVPAETTTIFCNIGYDNYSTTMDDYRVKSPYTHITTENRRLDLMFSQSKVYVLSDEDNLMSKMTFKNYSSDSNSYEFVITCNFDEETVLYANSPYDAGEFYSGYEPEGFTHTMEVIDLSNTPKIFTGTQAEWETLPTDEKKTYGQVNITDDDAGENLDYYSTTETKTNKVWIDGKPIYRKVVIQDLSSTLTGLVQINLDIQNIDTPIRIAWGRAEVAGANSGITIPAQYDDTTFLHLGVFDPSYVQLYAGSTNWTALNRIILCLEYTKTTD